MFFWNKNRKIEELEREVIILRDRNDFLEVELTKMNNDLEEYDELDISYCKLSQEIEEIKEKNKFYQIRYANERNRSKGWKERYYKVKKEIKRLEDAKRELMKDKDACKKALKNKVHRDKKGRFAKKDN